MARDIGPSWAVAEMSAGGAVEEPFPSIWIFTFGYILLNFSAQSVIRLLSVSEPIELRFPETPDTGLYGWMAGSTWTVWPTAEPARSAAARSAGAVFFILFLLRESNTAASLPAGRAGHCYGQVKSV